MPPKSKSANARDTLNLQVLQRMDRDIVRVEASTAHATLYKLVDGKDWKVEGVAGVFFLFARKKAPFWGIHIMNQKQFGSDFTRLITPDREFEIQASFLMFKDENEYYGVWFGVDDDRARMCELVMARAKSAEVGASPTVSYASKAGGAAASARPSDDASAGPAITNSESGSDDNTLQTILARAAGQQGASSQQASSDIRGNGGGGGGGDMHTPGSEQANLAKLLGAAFGAGAFGGSGSSGNGSGPAAAATTASGGGGGASDGAGGGGGGGIDGSNEKNHLMNLLAQATAKATSSPQGVESQTPTSTAGSEANRLAALLFNAVAKKPSGGNGDAGGGPSPDDDDDEGSAPPLVGEEEYSPAPMASRSHGAMATDDRGVMATDDRGGSAVNSGAGIETSPELRVVSPPPAVIKARPRAPANMAHLLQNPGSVTKVAVATPPKRGQPTVLERMRAQERAASGGSGGSSSSLLHAPRTSTDSDLMGDDTPQCAATTAANAVMTCVTETLTELVELQEAKARAKQNHPHMFSKAELQKVLLHVLASADSDALLSSFYELYRAIWVARDDAV